MKKIYKLLIILFVILVQSCTKKEDDLISQNCEIDCTEIIGKLMTDNGTTPISNHKITVVWDNSSLGSGTIRTKAMTRTNSNGEFYFNFYIRDDELKDGVYRMYYDELNGDNFIRADLNGIDVFQIKRDTTLVRNHNIPKKAFLNLTILNLEDIQTNNSFFINFEFVKPPGYSQSISGINRGWSNEFESNQLIEIAGNQPVIIEVIREIDNVQTTKYDTLFVNSGTTSNFTVDVNN